MKQNNTWKNISGKAGKKMLVGATVLVLVSAAFIWFAVGAAKRAPEFTNPNAALSLHAMKRLTPEQYRNIVRDIFGPSIAVPGRFIDTDQRDGGLLAVGAAKVSVTSMGFEEAEQVALEIAAQVMAAENRAEYIDCQPAPESKFDTACAKTFIGKVGRLLYRRPLLADELEEQLRIASALVRESGDFYLGLKRSLANLLLSPNFLFRMEYSQPDPGNAGGYRLDGFSIASRLSFLLWNSTPDSALLRAAEAGELHDGAGLQNQVARLLMSPRLERGVRAFFSDMLLFSEFDTLSKDRKLYPRFTRQALSDAREQMLRTLVDHLLVRKADYRELFTTPRTFLTPSLAALFAIPLVRTDTTYRAPDQWVPHTFAEGDPRAGILAQPAFVALHSHAGRTSPTLRGKALREVFLCQEVPPPPADVDFKVVEDTDNPMFKTTRQRLAAHATIPTCAGCHKITDPIGLALENFDSDGGFRLMENGAPIDTSGEIDGVVYAGPTGLGQALRGNPSIISCLVNRVFAYGAGREVTGRDRKWLKQVRKAFAGDGYQLKALLRQIAGSAAFYRAEAPARETVARR